MSSSIEGDRINRVRVRDDADDVSIHGGQTRLRQSERTSPGPLQEHRLQCEEGATSQNAGDRGASRRMLGQPNDPHLAPGPVFSLVDNIQDPVPRCDESYSYHGDYPGGHGANRDSNDIHAILKPTRDLFQDNRNEDDNNGPIFLLHQVQQQQQQIFVSGSNGPTLQSRNSNSAFINYDYTISSRSHFGQPVLPSSLLSPSSVHPLPPSAISLQVTPAATVGSSSISSFSSSSTLPLTGTMPTYPSSPIGLSDPTPSQPITPSSSSHPSSLQQQQHHSSLQQQQQQQQEEGEEDQRRHSHTQCHQNDSHSSNDFHLQRPTPSSPKITSSTHHHLHRQHLHQPQQSSPNLPSTISNVSPIISYPSHSHSSTLEHRHHPGGTTEHGSATFSSWTNPRLSHLGNSSADGRSILNNPQLSTHQQQQQEHHQQGQEQESRISQIDANYSMSIYSLQQVTPSSAFSSHASSPNRQSPTQLQQGQTRSSSHLALPSRDLFEGTSPSLSNHSQPTPPHPPQDYYQESSNSGDVGSSLMDEGGQDMRGTSRGRERRLQLADEGDRSDTRQPFPSSSYVPDGQHHTYISSPGETILHMGTPEGDSNVPRIFAPMTAFEDERREETDIERYSGLIMKSIAQSTTRRISGRSETSSVRRHLNHDLELGGRLSRSGTDLPPASLKGHAKLSSSSPLGPSAEIGDNEGKTEGPVVQEDAEVARSGNKRTRSNPQLAAFSFSSLKLSGLMSRLFGSKHTSASLNDIQNQNAGPSAAASSGHRTGVLSSSTAFGLRPTTEPTQQGDEKTDETAKSHQRTPKIQTSHSGGILSNLLKLQALSVPPPPSSRHRKRRRTHRRGSHQATAAAAAATAAAARKQNLRKSSLSSELLSPSSSTSQIVRIKRQASVISLPGLVMAAPSGVGFTPQPIPVTNEGGRGEGASSPVVATAPSTASALSADSSLFLRSSPSVFAAAATALGLQSPSIAERPLLGTVPTGGRERRESTQFLQTTYRQAHSTRSSFSADDSTSMCSGISHNPQLEAMRLHQQAELAEVLADIMLRQDLLIRLCKSLIRYGAPSHRIELAMEAMCKTFGIDGSFAFLPGLMMISFGDSDTHTSETHLIKCAQGFDMGRLAKVNKIARAVVYGDLDPSEALIELTAINNEKPPYGIWVMLASFAVSSGLIAPLVFKGSWYDMLAGMGLGSVVGLTSLLASRYSVYSNVFEVSTSIVIAFVAKALRDYVCFTGVVLSGIVMLLPGLSLTTAIMELSSRYMISGSVRMFYSLIYCLFLGFGLSIGSNLWDVFKEPPPGDLKMGYCHPATEPWRWILFPILAIAFNIQLYATPKQWPVMIVCSSVGYAVSEFAGLYWPHSLHIAAAVSAFVVGLLGNIYERLTHELAFVPILGAILLIVPGGMGVRSSLLLLDQSGNAAQGTAFALQMIVVALGIAVGLFASTLIVYPLGKKRNALLTF